MRILRLLFLLIISPLPVLSQIPTLLDNELSIREVIESPDESVGLSYNKVDNKLYMLTQNGSIFVIDIEGGKYSQIQSSSNHGLEDVQGFDISGDGYLYLVGNRKDDKATNTGIIKKAEISDDGWNWVTVAESEPYPLSNTYFDHVMNGIVVSPDNKYLYINSGSRTDHGEEHLGHREVPLTAKIFRIPADSVDLLLKNDIDYLKDNGYIFAEGTRNSFSMAFDAEGNLFATENAGERDDPEELNWLREGHHYGFPWYVGGNTNPMQFEGYDPDEDLLITENSASYHYFYDDPDYPAPPEGVTFTDPILNYGPDAVNYRDAQTGEIFSASKQDTAISSFTSHRSPLGLVFDTTGILLENYTGDAFALSFAGIDDDWYLLRFMDDPGEDLLHIKLTKNENRYEMTSTTIASGFTSPVDAELIENKMYVIEHKGNGLNAWANTKVWEITFPAKTTSNEEPVPIAKNIQLNQNYPNPFNPNTEISYSLHKAGNVQLKVFDALGREIQVLVNSTQQAGQHFVSFRGVELPSGVYFYTLELDGIAEQTKKMILLK